MRNIKKVYIPLTGGGVIYSHTKKHIKGRGGSVLLNGGEGGYGSASSYSSLDDYINTTGLNPYRNQPLTMSGNGINSINNKLEKLLINPRKGRKEKNINFNL